MENNYTPTPASTPEFPMKWHKFLIYLSLWAAAVVNLFTAISYFNGSIYGNEAYIVYQVFPGLKGLDSVMGIIMIAFAIFSIVTRFALAGYKANGPKFLIAMYIANVAISVIYLIAASSISRIGIGELLNSSTISQLVVGIAMAFINKTYYGNRAALFVN